MKFLCGIQRLVEVASPSAPPVPQVPEGAWVSQQPEVEPGCVQRPCRDKLHSKEPFSLSGCSLSSGPAALTPTWQDHCFNWRGAGTHLLPLHTHQAPTGLHCGHHVQGEGAFLHIRQGMCKMCKICKKMSKNLLP